MGTVEETAEEQKPVVSCLETELRMVLLPKFVVMERNDLSFGYGSAPDSFHNVGMECLDSVHKNVLQLICKYVRYVCSYLVVPLDIKNSQSSLLICHFEERRHCISSECHVNILDVWGC